MSNFLDDSNWPTATLAAFVAEFNNTSEANTQDLLLCGPAWLDSLKARQLDPENIRPRLPLGRHWRRLFTDAVLFKILGTLDAQARKETLQATKSTSEESIEDSTCWNYLVSLLDLTIILAGAPGERRLELVHSCIAYIQHKYLPPTLPDIQPADPNAHRSAPLAEIPLLSRPVPKIESLPTFSSFPSLAQRPFVMPGFAADWPAIGKWWSKAYLLACSGRGRVVPIERGGDYRTEDWGVDIMPWDVFLDRIGWGESQTEPTGDAERLYLAQHSLFTQFPKLRADLLIPDYVYTTPSTQPPDYSGPPGNDEQLVINAWCGGRGANSPAHTDPYYNIYVQVVGYKRIWLAPPDATPGMYVYNKTSNDDEKTTGGTSMDRDPKRDGMLGNTSSVDVFALSAPDSNSSEHPLFYTYTLPLAQSTTLRPGDALVIPPGWWHAMRGVDSGSFSVSFWF